MTKEYIENSFSDLNSTSINYCVLRNYKELPENVGNDIDILIDFKKLKAVQLVFLNNANKYGLIFLKEKRRDGYLGLYFFEPKSSEVILIDLFYKLQKRWNNYADVDYILSNRINYKNFYVINPSHEIYTITMKELLTYGFVRHKYFNLFNTTNLNVSLFKEAANRFLSNEETNNLLNLVISKEVFNKKAKQTLNLKKPAVYNHLRNIIIYINMFLLSKLKNLFGPSPIVCLIGPDGVGKSTLSNTLKDACVKANLYKSAKVYHHRFDIIPSISALLRKTPSAEVNFNPDFGHVNTVHTKLRTLVYMFYYSLDFLLGYGVVIKAKLKNEIIIFDRYYFDFFIQNSYSAVSKKTKKSVYFFLPKPLTTIFLYANPYMVVARKKELTIAQHIQQNEQCLYILKSVVKNPIFLNCNGSIKQNKRLLIFNFFRKVSL